VTRIVAITKSGYAARVLASFLPRQPIIAVSNDPAMVRQFNLLRGVQGVLVDAPFARSSTAHIPSCLEALWRRGILADDDLIVVTAVAYPASGNRMNLIETHVVSDLKTSLCWAPRVRPGSGD
jgi:pyruvate kinase